MLHRWGDWCKQRKLDAASPPPGAALRFTRMHDKQDGACSITVKFWAMTWLQDFLGGSFILAADFGPSTRLTGVLACQARALQPEMLLLVGEKLDHMASQHSFTAHCIVLW